VSKESRVPNFPHIPAHLDLGNINNYKGVMLCTRPNENIAVVKDKLVYLGVSSITILSSPFISRVDPKDQLGINPVRKVKTIGQRKRGLKPFM